MRPGPGEPSTNGSLLVTFEAEVGMGFRTLPAGIAPDTFAEGKGTAAQMADVTPSPLSIVPEPSSSQFPVAPDGLHLQLHWELRPEPWERGHKGLHSSGGGRQALVPQPAFLSQCPQLSSSVRTAPFPV